MKQFKPKEYDMKVRSITKIEREKEDSEIVRYRLMARDKDGVNEIVIVSAIPFTGISPKDGVIQVVISNSQKSIEEFVEKKEEKEKED